MDSDTLEAVREGDTNFINGILNSILTFLENFDLRWSKKL